MKAFKSWIATNSTFVWNTWVSRTTEWNLFVEKHWSTHKQFAQTPEPYQPSIANGSCNWTWRICGITSAIILHEYIMSLFESSFRFPARNNNVPQSRAGQGHCQFHLPIPYHHLENAGCFVTAWVRGDTLLLSDTQKNIRQERYIISLEFALIRRQDQGLRSPNKNLTTNQIKKNISSLQFTVSWFWRITFNTNISHPS